MVWRRTGHKPISEPTLTKFIDAYMRRPEIYIYRKEKKFQTNSLKTLSCTIAY